MNWTDQHASNTAALLKTTPLLGHLADNKPKYEGRTLEDKAMSASVREGYEMCMAEIVAASEQVSAKQPPSPFIEGLEQFEQRATGQ
jgi:hypothetical protein